MTTEVKNIPKDCMACRITGSVGLISIGAYLANVGWKSKSFVGKILISTTSLAFVSIGIARYKQEYPFNKNVENSQ